VKGQSIPYSADELAWIEARKTWVRTELAAAFREQFGREDVRTMHLHALCKRKGWATGRNGCFAPGQTPFNKGAKMPFNPNSAATRFKKGNLPHNTHYLGHERVSKEGYVEISVAEANPHTGYERRYVLKHRHLWEQANGPLPDGMCLKCLDGDRANTDPANWEAIPRAILPRLNGGRFKTTLAFDEAHPELRPTILAIAKLDHKARATKARRGA
jgi:hypothetical protein